MPAGDLAALDSAALARRLHQLVGDERRVQVDFLLHLDAFDARQAFLELGFGSLWDYCLKALHLREGAAGRRIGAMRVLRRFPKLEAPLRDGRLCLSTASLLGQVLTDENLEELVGRAAFRTKAEVEQLVVSIRPRPVPREGIRRVTDRAPSGEAAPAPGLASAAKWEPQPGLAPAEVAPATPKRDPPVSVEGGAAELPASAGGAPMLGRRAEVEPVAQDRWSLRVTLDVSLKEDIETLKMLLGHKIVSGDLSEVLREAVRCGIEKHGKRRGTVEPAYEKARVTDRGVRGGARAIPASVRREVWARDGGRCTFEAEDGRRCGSRWQLELDHVHPAALGGAPTIDNLRLRCRRHNILHAEEVYGREHMARFRSGQGTTPRTGEFAIAGDSA